ncbi:hypothetical protein PENSPDRAFT_44844 [Peniophora sp. CONT]|nr:hypothetical protein PENSPDRAFT_44844 [Peniophora sp. CONT]
MAPSTRSKTGSLPSEMRKRAAESDTELEPKASSSSGQPRTKARKRAKVTHNEAEVQTSKRAPRQRVRGLLKALPDMPLDVLDEIFLLCEPATLVSIARTNKAFCRLLQSADFEHVWREAFACNEDIPEAPMRWSLVKWAGLLFGGKHCQSCLRTKVDAVSFGILKRMCRPCIEKSMIECRPSLRQVIPTAAVNFKDDTGTYNLTFAYKRDLDNILYTIDDLQKMPRVVQDYWNRKRGDFSSQREHACRAEEWQQAKLDHEAKLVEDARSARKDSLKNAKEARRDEITSRILAAGYDPYKDGNGVFKLKGVNVAKPLTDEDWAQLWPSIESLMKANKVKRRVGAVSKKHRKELRARAERAVGDYVDKLGLTQYDRSFWPSDEELLRIEPLASFLQRGIEGNESSDDESSDDGSSDDRPSKLVSAVVAAGESARRTLNALDFDLARKVLSVKSNANVNDPARILSLATSVLVVNKTKNDKANVYVYFGREVLLAARHHADWLRDLPFADTFPATFSPVGSATVRQILKMCKLKSSTTILELDDHDAHFVCVTCRPALNMPDAQGGKEVPSRQVLSWRTAVGHACRAHHKVPAPSMELRLLTKNERAILTAKSYKKIPGYDDYNIEHVAPTCFRCNHCDHDNLAIPKRRRTGQYEDSLLTLEEVMKHLQDKHDIPANVAKEGLDYWYHPRFRRGLLKSTMTEFHLIV